MVPATRTENPGIINYKYQLCENFHKKRELLPHVTFFWYFSGLPTIYHIFANSVPPEERSRAFGYLVAAGSVGQTVASVMCPHIPWQASFYFFGTLGIIWVLLCTMFYQDSSKTDEIPLFLPKVTIVGFEYAE